MVLTGTQVKHLYEFLGGDYDTSVTIKRFEARTDTDTGEDMPAGLYAWCTDYPGEGSVFLPPDGPPPGSGETPGEDAVWQSDPHNPANY